MRTSVTVVSRSARCASKFALAYNLANFLRSLVLSNEVARWSLATLREKLVKIGARIVRLRGPPVVA